MLTGIHCEKQPGAALVNNFVQKRRVQIWHRFYNCPCSIELTGRQMQITVNQFQQAYRKFAITLLHDVHITVRKNLGESLG